MGNEIKVKKHFQDFQDFKGLNYVNDTNYELQGLTDFSKEQPFNRKLQQRSKEDNLDELYSKVDNCFKQLLNAMQFDEDKKKLYRFKNELECSLKEVRISTLTTKFNQRSIDQFNFRLDQQLNHSFRKQFFNEANLINEDLPVSLECDISKFELFTYLSLYHYNLYDLSIEQWYPELKKEDKIKNLILFINTNRSSSIGLLVRRNLKLCLNNLIDTIQVGYETSKLLKTIKLNSLSSFSYLTFLILDLNYNLIKLIDLHFINDLIALRHLEIYGRKFNFKKAGCYNTSIANLIIHDKLIKNVSILDLFPNLILIKIQHSSGDILKSFRCLFRLSHFKFRHFESNQQKQLRVINLPCLSFNDFKFIINNCKKVELIEFSLICPLMIEYLKQLPYLKFIFLNLRKDQYRISRSLIYLIHYHLDESKDLFYYANQLYCPKELFKKSISPCFRRGCLNCSSNKGLKKDEASCFRPIKSSLNRIKFNILTNPKIKR